MTYREPGVKPRIALIGIALSLLVVSGCGGEVDGRAGPAPDATSGGRTGDTTEPTTASNDVGSLEDADPCTLLTRAEAEQVTGSLRDDPAREDAGTARGCGFNAKNGSFSVDIRTNAGLASVNAPGQVTDVPVGRHQAKRFVGNTGSCVVAIGVTETSRVDVVLNASGGEGDPCEMATRIAELVEPRLP